MVKAWVKKWRVLIVVVHHYLDQNGKWPQAKMRHRDCVRAHGLLPPRPAICLWSVYFYVIRNSLHDHYLLPPPRHHHHSSPCNRDGVHEGISWSKRETRQIERRRKKADRKRSWWNVVVTTILHDNEQPQRVRMVCTTVVLGPEGLTMIYYFHPNFPILTHHKWLKRLSTKIYQLLMS